MKKTRQILSILILYFCIYNIHAERKNDEFFPFRASYHQSFNPFSLKTNIVPWVAAIPNLGIEYGFNDHWSAALDVMFSPWKISENHSIKTVALMPEGRYWLKNNSRGSFFNIHANVAWFNIRWNSYRYQDVSYPLLGAGIGYGYRLPVSSKFCFEFTIGAGMFVTKYDRFFNVENGALADTKVTTYWGLDKIGINLVYMISEL